MMKFLAAIALATAVSAGAVSAQSEMDGMTEGLSMLEVGASKQFAKIGIEDVDVMTLSLSQLAQIKTVLEQSDYTVNEQEQQVRKIIGTN